MKYNHRFRVQASLAKVAEFHSRSASMSAITPPPIIVKVRRAPDILAKGDEMDFTMWLGPLPLRWLARIETVSPNGFSDRQLLGPFTEWTHRHSFNMVSEQATYVFDEITLKFRNHPFWWSIGLGMLLGMPFLFAYREWKTKRMLE